jgi:hypothetical protein
LIRAIAVGNVWHDGAIARRHKAGRCCEGDDDDHRVVQVIKRETRVERALARRECTLHSRAFLWRLRPRVDSGQQAAGRDDA